MPVSTQSVFPNLDVLTLARELYALTLESGGCTVNATGQTPLDGYAVAVTTLAKYPRALFTTASVTGEPLGVIEIARALTLCPDGYFVGTWCDDGEVYTEITEVLPSDGPLALALALTVGVGRQQQAIWDVRNAQAIDC